MASVVVLIREREKGERQYEELSEDCEIAFGVDGVVDLGQRGGLLVRSPHHPLSNGSGRGNEDVAGAVPRGRDLYDL